MPGAFPSQHAYPNGIVCLNSAPSQGCVLAIQEEYRSPGFASARCVVHAVSLKGSGVEREFALQDSSVRLNSCLIRNFLRGTRVCCTPSAMPLAYPEHLFTTLACILVS